MASLELKLPWAPRGSVQEAARSASTSLCLHLGHLVTTTVAYSSPQVMLAPSSPSSVQLLPGRNLETGISSSPFNP